MECPLPGPKAKGGCDDWVVNPEFNEMAGWRYIIDSASQKESVTARYSNVYMRSRKAQEVSDPVRLQVIEEPLSPNIETSS